MAMEWQQHQSHQMFQYSETNSDQADGVLFEFNIQSSPIAAAVEEENEAHNNIVNIFNEDDLFEQLLFESTMQVEKSLQLNFDAVATNYETIQASFHAEDGHIYLEHEENHQDHSFHFDIDPVASPGGQRQEQLTTFYTQDEPLQFATDAKAFHTISSNNTKDEKKSLEQWGYNRKTKRRFYINSSGEVFYGSEAVKHANKDKMNQQNNNRAELHYEVSSKTLTTLLQFDKQEILYLTSWGIPRRIINRYSQHMSCPSSGVHLEPRLFPWQADCLLTNHGSSIIGGNLIYSAPTSGGKTLVSEILMLRRLALYPQGTIFFVVPFVALAIEKAAYFRSMWQDMQVGVRGFHGGESDESGASSSLTSDISVAVCTFEKCNALLNQLLHENLENRLSMIVVDEIHMLSENSRGFLLEIILSKIKYLNKRGSMRTQIVGMSATLPNISDMATWLGAALYTTSYRPVELSILIGHEGRLYNLTRSADGDISNSHRNSNSTTCKRGTYSGSSYAVEEVRSVGSHWNRTEVLGPDADGSKALVIETIRENKSIMIFGSSKLKCVSYAELYAEVIERCCSQELLLSPPTDALTRDRKLLIQDLVKCPFGLCPVLEKTIKWGVAYHNSTLSADERRLIEAGYKSGVLNVLCATSTLSAGVNLPANKVIIKEARLGRAVLKISQFRQMCGRAGRMGLDTTGEAILMIQELNTECLDAAAIFILGEVEPLTTSLDTTNRGGLEKLLLELISCGKITQRSQINEYINCTLLGVQRRPQQVELLTQTALSKLYRGNFLFQYSALTAGDVLECNQLGMATAKSGLAPSDVELMLPHLEAAQHRRFFLTGSGLHAIFLITPPLTKIVPNWADYFNLLERLYKTKQEYQEIAEFLGISIGRALHFKTCPPPFDVTLIPDRASYHEAVLYRRFYGSLLLCSLVQETPMVEILRYFPQAENRGDIQTMQQEAASHCRMTVALCETMNWHLLGTCLEIYADRLSFGVRDELIPLVRLGHEMPQLRARKFFEHGLATPLDIVNAGLAKIVTILMESLPFQGSKPLKTNQRPPLRLPNDAKNDEDETLDVISRESCCRLAKKIVSRAKEQIRKEMELLNSS